MVRAESLFRSRIGFVDDARIADVLVHGRYIDRSCCRSVSGGVGVFERWFFAGFSYGVGMETLIKRTVSLSSSVLIGDRLFGSSYAFERLLRVKR
jgi:hypothetical protein